MVPVVDPYDPSIFPDRYYRGKPQQWHESRVQWCNDVLEALDTLGKVLPDGLRQSIRARWESELEEAQLWLSTFWELPG